MFCLRAVQTKRVEPRAEKSLPVPCMKICRRLAGIFFISWELLRFVFSKPAEYFKLYGDKRRKSNGTDGCVEKSGKGCMQRSS